MPKSYRILRQNHLSYFIFVYVYTCTKCNIVNRLNICIKSRCFAYKKKYPQNPNIFPCISKLTSDFLELKSFNIYTPNTEHYQ